MEVTVNLAHSWQSVVAAAGPYPEMVLVWTEDPEVEPDSTEPQVPGWPAKVRQEVYSGIFLPIMAVAAAVPVEHRIAPE